MEELFKSTVADAENTESYLTKAFEQSEYQLVEISNLRTQKPEIPSQLVVRGDDAVILDKDGEIVQDDGEVYARLLLGDEVEVVVQDSFNW